jgi:hypothetical protein
MQATALRLAKEKNSFARWAAVIAPTEYVPYRRCRKGDLTRIRAGDDQEFTPSGGVTGGGIGTRLVRCMDERPDDGGAIVSDLAVFGTDLAERTAFQSLEAFIVHAPERAELRAETWSAPNEQDRVATAPPMCVESPDTWVVGSTGEVIATD